MTMIFLFCFSDYMFVVQLAAHRVPLTSMVCLSLGSFIFRKAFINEVFVHTLIFFSAKKEN